MFYTQIERRSFHTAWVKTGKAPCEHMFSALLPEADVALRTRYVRFVPGADQIARLSALANAWRRLGAIMRSRVAAMHDARTPTLRWRACRRSAAQRFGPCVTANTAVRPPAGPGLAVVHHPGSSPCVGNRRASAAKRFHQM